MLPSWLTESQSYDPPHDSDRFLSKNILSLVSALTVFRAEAAPVSQLAAWERLLTHVPAAIRFLGVLVLVICMSLARNMAFVWVMLAAELVLLALKPAQRIRAVFLPSLAAAGIALIINVPALLLGQMSAPVRMGAKVLATMLLVTNLAQGIGPEGLVRALRSLGLPSQVVMTVDLALRDIVLLGESAKTLSEALALRSVGRDASKTTSAAGVMGTTFLHAQRMAAARAEAMELRGYGPYAIHRRQKTGRDASVVVYACLMLLAVALFVYLEVSMP